MKLIEFGIKSIEDALHKGKKMSQKMNSSEIRWQGVYIREYIREKLTIIMNHCDMDKALLNFMNEMNQVDLEKNSVHNKKDD